MNKLTSFGLVLFLCAQIISGHGGEPDPTQIGVGDGQSYDFVLDLYSSTTLGKTYTIPGLNESLSLEKGTEFTLIIDNAKLELDEVSDVYWISSSVLIDYNTTNVVLYVGENALISFLDWETIEHTKQEELEGSKVYYENRGGKYNYDIWMDDTEFGYYFEFDISEESSTYSQKQIKIFNLATGVLEYYYNTYSEESDGALKQEEFLLKNPDYTYNSNSEATPVNLYIIISSILVLSALIKNQKMSKKILY